MKLYMKQKVFSWKDRFTVRDEAERDRFFIEGEFLSFGKKLHVFNAEHQEVAFIREKVLAWMPRFFVEIGGREVCQIVRRFTMLKPKYELEGLGWQVQGDFWAHEYAVMDGGREVMSLSKHWFSWGDSYELDIVDTKDELVCLCIVLAIDAAISDDNAVASTSATT